MDILCRDRTKSLSGFAGFQDERNFQLVDFSCELFGSGDFTPLSLRASGLEVVDLAQRILCDFEALTLRKQKIAGISATDFDNVSFRAERRNIGCKDNFGVCHRI